MNARLVKETDTSQMASVCVGLLLVVEQEQSPLLPRRAVIYSPAPIFGHSHMMPPNRCFPEERASDFPPT